MKNQHYFMANWIENTELQCEPDISSLITVSP